MTPRIFTSARSGICSPMVEASRVTSSKCGELLREDAVGEPDARQQQAEEDHAEGLELECRRPRQPASLTVVVAPQIAIERNRSITLIATMLVRTALPTATPTPAGPPEAL